MRGDPERPNKLLNDFLGQVFDEANVLNHQSSSNNTELPPEGHLVELCLARDTKNGNAYRRFWKVLRDHGVHSKGVNKVALKVYHFIAFKT